MLDGKRATVKPINSTQAGVDRYCFYSHAYKIYPCKNCIFPQLLWVLPFTRTGLVTERCSSTWRPHSKWRNVDVFPAQASCEKLLFSFNCDRMIEQFSNFVLSKENFRALRFLRDKRDQVKSCVFGHGLTVLFSSKFIFYPGEWVTCAATSVKDAILFSDTSFPPP